MESLLERANLDSGFEDDKDFQKTTPDTNRKDWTNFVSE